MAVLNLGHVVGADGTNGKDGASCLRNLLDNSDFANPVNQRGATGAVSGWAYCIDRWLNRTSTAGTLAITSDGIQFDFQLCQYLPETLKDGTVVTAAARWTDGAVLVANGTITRSATWKWFSSGVVDNCVIGVVDAGNGSQSYIRIESDGTKTLQWAALYEGTYTADTLPEYVPKGYGAEYAECCRYYYAPPSNAASIYPGAIVTSTVCRVTIKTPAPMRIKPTLSIKDISNALVYAEKGYPISAVSVLDLDKDAVIIATSGTFTTTNLAANVRFYSTVELSADL